MKQIFLIAILLFSLFPAISNAQENQDYYQRVDKLGQPLFSLRTVRRLEKNDGKIRVDFYIEVMNDLLQFVRNKEEFSTSVELNLSIIAKDGGQVDRATKFISRTVATYPMTNSRNDYLNGSFTSNLFPGEYIAKVMLIDQESKRKEFVENKFKIEPDFAVMEFPGSQNQELSKFNLSDMVLTRSTEIDNEINSPVDPTINGNIVETSDKLFGFFDVYRENTMETCKLLLTVFNRAGEEEYRDSLTVVGGNKLSSYFIPIDCSNFTTGKYNAILRGEYNSQNIVRQVQILVNSHGLPMVIQNIDQAIEQMRYIATSAEIRLLNEAFPSDREQVFIEFWDSHFPSQGEFTNGKMLEYYSRIKYANENFGNTRAGWETDRGNVLVIYGKPSEVERHDYNTQGVPYEIWYYHHLGKRFVFQDEYGFGEYRRISPIW